MARHGFTQSTVVHVGVAFLGMGAWAWWANRTHGAGAWLPAVMQGVLSGSITYGLKALLERLSRRFAGWPAYALPPAFTATVILSLLVCVHQVIGTPEVALTIAVPWTVSTLYAVVYTASLAKRKHT